MASRSVIFKSCFCPPAINPAGAATAPAHADRARTRQLAVRLPGSKTYAAAPPRSAAAASHLKQPPPPPATRYSTNP
jgi:hypothetical protein